MKFAPATNRGSGFTLAEVLAALLFMAIVVPVAMQGLHIASLAGAVAQRKGEAARIAQKVINESLITTNWSQTLRSDPWNQDPGQNTMRQLSVEVFFTAQTRDYSVKMSTLVDSSQLLGSSAF